jgi:hypothetical protein
MLFYLCLEAEQDQVALVQRQGVVKMDWDLSSNPQLHLEMVKQQVEMAARLRI